MAWTVANPVSIGMATKKAHFDALWDNCDMFKTQHGTDGTHGAVTATSLASSSITPSNLTASMPVSSDGAKKLVSSTITGTGKVVMDTSPTLVTPTIGAASGTSLTLSGLTASLPVFTDGSKALVSKSIADTQTALGLGAWTDYSGTTVVVGFSIETIKVYYKSFPEYCLVHFNISGTSDDNVFTFTLPLGLISKNTIDTAFCVANCTDNSSIGGSGFGNLQKASTTVVLYYATWGGAWTASGAKAATGNFWFPT
jgi:hypothetical protein